MRHVVISLTVLFLFLQSFAQSSQRLQAECAFRKANITGVNLAAKTAVCESPFNAYQVKGAARDADIEHERILSTAKVNVYASYFYLKKNGKWKSVPKSDYQLVTVEEIVTKSGAKYVVQKGTVNWSKGVPAEAKQLMVKFWARAVGNKPVWINQADVAFNDDGNNMYNYRFVIDLQTGKVSVMRG